MIDTMQEPAKHEHGYPRMPLTDQKRAEICAAFNKAVNMSPATLAQWLESEESHKVGWKGADGKGSGESVGHASGRRILTIKAKKKVDLTDDDYKHMAKVVGYVARHTAQRPENTVTSRWRYSLMNWGHDPLDY